MVKKALAIASFLTLFSLVGAGVANAQVAYSTGASVSGSSVTGSVMSTPGTIAKNNPANNQGNSTGVTANTSNTSDTVTPSLPNTGSGGAMAGTLALLLVSGAIAVAGAAFLTTRKFVR